MRDAARASVPGKLVLMGEHAAVYGVPAVVAAIDLRCTVSVLRTAHGGVLLDLSDIGVRCACSWEALAAHLSSIRRAWCAYDANATPETFAAMRGDDPASLVKALLGELAHRHVIGHRNGIAVRVRSRIPMAAGFGSSAAMSVGLAAAALAMLGRPSSMARVESLARQGERLQHGRPSGIDHATALSGGLLCITGSRTGRAHVLPLGLPGEDAGRRLPHLEVYDTGAAGEPTGAVVTVVAKRFASDPRIIRDMASTAESFVELMRGGVADPSPFAEAIRRYEACLERLGVVPPSVRGTIRDIESAGGAAKICGAGSLSGPGAGAMLVVWPEGAPPVRPASLGRLRRLDVRLGAPGCAVEVA
ncbi:mevalonate kinase family protein [Luteibacter yeojuensis]